MVRNLLLLVLSLQDVLVGLLRLRQVSGRIQHERQAELRGRWVRGMYDQPGSSAG
jgi:hypothetical protein